MLAQRIPLANKTIKFRIKLYKTKNSLVIYIRTERINLKAYLYSRKISGIDLFNCDCGWVRQTIKYILIFCIIWTKLRNRILTAAESLNYRKIVSTAKRLKAATKIIINTGLLSQFKLIKTLLYDKI